MDESQIRELVSRVISDELVANMAKDTKAHNEALVEVLCDQSRKVGAETTAMIADFNERLERIEDHLGLERPRKN